MATTEDDEEKDGKLKVVLADDHTLVRQGIENLLNTQQDIEIVSQTGDGYELLNIVESKNPDLVIVDISMPRLNGLEATCRMKDKDTSPKVILLSSFQDDEYIRRALVCGARGYVLKDEAIEELVGAIDRVQNEGYYFSPPVLNSIVGMFRRELSKISEEYLDLTSREREVLQLIAEGNSNKEIAEIISRSVETVRTHRANIMEKLDLHSAEELTEYALEKGIVKETDL